MRVIRQRIAKLLEVGGVSADQSGRIAAEVVALALGDAYQRAVRGIAEADDSAAFAGQIAGAVHHAFHRPK